MEFKSVTSPGGWTDENGSAVEFRRITEANRYPNLWLPSPPALWGRRAGDEGA
jgi:hypothetical protein